MNPSNFILVVDDDPTGAFITKGTIGRLFPDCPIHIRNSVEAALVAFAFNAPLKEHDLLNLN